MGLFIIILTITILSIIGCTIFKNDGLKIILTGISSAFGIITLFLGILLLSKLIDSPNELVKYELESLLLLSINEESETGIPNKNVLLITELHNKMNIYNSDIRATKKNWNNPFFYGLYNKELKNYPIIEMVSKGNYVYFKVVK